ncbi:lytic transglycosylase domain-containing protein [bacterium]|nr:MAG: lytic transglycosylase domain-containing protein [bacterium]
MQILNQKINKNISKDFSPVPFNAPEHGLYTIEIIASCKNWFQNWNHLFNDDDLTVKIDNIEFPKLNGKNGLFNGEVAWNGNNLKGLKKTNVFIIKLESGDHKLNFIINQHPYIESIKINKLEDDNVIKYIPESNKQAQDEDNRQWINIILINLPVKNIKILAKAEKREKDRDDIKLIINGAIQKNPNPDSDYFKNWYWCGSLDDGQEKTFNKEFNEPKRLHYIELWADRMPTLNEVEVFLGEKAKIVWDSTILREEPKIEDDNILIEEIEQGERVDILERAVKGDRPKNSNGVLLSSNRWHRVKYDNQEGYIYSEAIEIDSEDDETIKKMIIQKSKEMDLDAEILLALAQCESQSFPYTVSYDEKLPEIAFGVMQISGDLFIDLNDPQKSFYSPFENIFDIEKNIQGGVKYFDHLYNGKYKDDPDRLRKTIAAYNSGPGNVSLDKPLNLDIHENQTNRLVNCVSNHLNKRTFKNIIKKFLPVILLISLCSLGWISRSDKNMDIKKLNIQADLTTENVEVVDNMNDIDQPKIVWDEENRNINFFNENSNLKGSIDSRRLQLDSMFQIPIDETSDNSIRIYDEIIEYPENVFYFLTSTFYMCGAQNCTWVLYKYDIENDSIEFVADDIFGASIGLYPNPDFNKIAVTRHVHGGYCNSGGYVNVVDLLNLETKKVNKFNESYQTSYINFLKWKDNDKIEFGITHSNCDPDFEREPLKEVLEYDTEKSNDVLSISKDDTEDTMASKLMATVIRGESILIDSNNDGREKFYKLIDDLDGDGDDERF